jgi:hypothetical protein
MTMAPDIDLLMGRQVWRAYENRQVQSVCRRAAKKLTEQTTLI